MRTDITVIFYRQGPNIGNQGDLQIHTSEVIQRALYELSTLLCPLLLHVQRVGLNLA